MQRKNPAKLLKRISSIRRYDPQPSTNAPHSEELLILNQILRLKQGSLESFSFIKFKKEMWDLRTLAEGVVQSTLRKLVDLGMDDVSHIVSAVIELYSTVMETLLQQVDRADKKEPKSCPEDLRKNRMCSICNSSIEESKLNIVRKYIDATWVDTLKTEVKPLQDQGQSDDGDYDENEYVKIVDKMLANKKAYSYKVSRTSDMLQEAVNIDIQKKSSYQAKISFSDGDVKSAKDAIDYALKMLGSEFKGQITAHMVPVLQRLISKYMCFQHQKQQKMFESIHVQTDKTDELDQLKSVQDRAEMLHKKLYLKNLELEDLKKNCKNRDHSNETSMEITNSELKKLEVQNGHLRETNIVQQKSIRVLEQQVRKLEKFVETRKSVVEPANKKVINPDASKSIPEDNQSVQQCQKIADQNKPHRLNTNSSVEKSIVRTATESSSKDPKTQKSIYLAHSNDTKRPGEVESPDNAYKARLVTTKKGSMANNNSSFSRKKFSEVGIPAQNESTHTRSSSNAETTKEFGVNASDLAKTVSSKNYQTILTTTTNLPKTKPIMMLKSKKTAVVNNSEVVSQSNLKQNPRQPLVQILKVPIDMANISRPDIPKEIGKTSGTPTNREVMTQAQVSFQTEMGTVQSDSKTKAEVKQKTTLNKKNSNDRQSYADLGIKSSPSKGVIMQSPSLAQSKNTLVKHQSQSLHLEQEQHVLDLDQEHKSKQQLLKLANLDIQPSIRSPSYEDFKYALCEQIGVTFEEVKQLQSSVADTRLSRNIPKPGRLPDHRLDPTVNKTKQNRITLETIHNSPMVSKRQSKIHKFFTTKDLSQLFGSIQQAYHFQSVKIDPKTRQVASLRTFVGQLYNHIDGMKKTDNNLYQWIKNFIKFPYQTAVNNNNSSDLVSNFSQTMLETLFGRILTLHTKCDKRQEEPYCQHIKGFLGKIKFGQETVDRQNFILPAIESKK